MAFWVIQRDKLLRLTAVFILGLIIGVASAMLHSASTLDQAAIQMEMLNSELEERQDQIERLKSNLQDWQVGYVRTIEVNVDVRDPHLNLRVSREIKGLVGELHGSKVDSVDPQLVAAILNRRLIQVENRTYELTLDYLVISETVQIYAQAVEVD